MIDVLGADARREDRGASQRTHTLDLPPALFGRGVLRVRFDHLEPGGCATHTLDCGAACLTSVVDGLLEYSDGAGRDARVLGGEVQLVEADAALERTLANGSQTDTLELVTLEFSGDGAATRCEQRYFSDDARRNHLCTVLSPDAGRDALRFTRPITVLQSSLTGDDAVILPTPAGHVAVLCATTHAVSVEGQTLAAGECAVVTRDVPDLRLHSAAPAEVLVALAGPATRE